MLLLREPAPDLDPALAAPGPRNTGLPAGWHAPSVMRIIASLSTAAGLFIMLAALFACTYVGRDDALSQRFTWFSYLNGHDIRAQCAPGALDRYRFVYNGVYVKQARTYDIVPDAASGFVLKARVLGPSDLSNVAIPDPITTLVQDPLDILAPFAGTKGSIGLGGRDIDALDRALAQSGFFQPAPAGLYLRSEDFFWVGVACVGGRLTFNAFRFPSDRFANLTFPRLLFDWDPTGIAINPPRELTPFDIYGQSNIEDKYPRFTLTVGTNGLAGTGTLF